MKYSRWHWASSLPPDCPTKLRITRKLSELIWAADLLKVDHISAGYGNIQVLNDVSLEAQPNRITVIVGPNGSGKSTLLKTIAGLTSIYQGQVMLDNKIVSKRPPHEIARLGIAYLPQTESTFTRLTVSENFKMAGYFVDYEGIRERFEEGQAIVPKHHLYT